MAKTKLLSLLAGLLTGISATAQNGTPVLQTDFTNGADHSAWTVADTNDDALCWGYDADLLGYAYNGIGSTAAANDWLVTPAFAVKAGSHYRVELTLARRGCRAADDLTIYHAEQRTPGAAGAAEVVHVTPDWQAGVATLRCDFQATGTSDQHHVMLHLQSAADNGILSLKSLRIVETDGQQPLSAPDMTAYSDGNSGEVRLKWYNPNRDTEGAIITRPMTAIVTVDGTQVAALSGMQPGEMSAYTLTPASFSGQHTYGVSLQLDNLTSDAVTRSLDLDDVKGEAVDVKAFSLSNKTAFADWAVENLDGSNTWTYDYGAVYVSAFGRNIDDWLITPAATLEAGKRYMLTYQVKTSTAYPATFDVTVGTAQNSTAQTRVITTHADVAQNGYGDYASPQFEVSEDGEYYFGFHATYVGNSLDLRNVTLKVMQAGEPQGEETDPVWSEAPLAVSPDTLVGGLDVTLPYHQRLSPEGVELYAAITQAQIDEYTLAPTGIYHMDHALQYQPQLQNGPLLNANFSGGVVYHNGRLYCNEYNSTGNYQEAIPVWKVIDAKTMQVLSQNDLKGNCENTTIAMAYNVKNDKIYGFVKDYSDTWFVEINPADGAMQRIGDRMDPYKRYVTLGSNSKGDMYCIYVKEDYITGDQTCVLSRIDPATGTFADMGEIQGANLMADDIVYNMKYRQALFCDNSTNKFYWLLGSSSAALGSQYAPVFELNPLSAVATLRTWVTNVYAISGAYFNEPLMEVPAGIEDFAYTPDAEGSTTGTISFRMPATTYDGTPIGGSLQYSVTEINADEPIQLNGTAEAGSTVSLHIESTQGLHTLHIIASNAAGESPVAERKFLIGYDLPAEPRNIVASNEGRDVTVCWEAPATGINGEIYDASKLTYDVVRYPDYIDVASGLTVPYFTETVPSELSRYVYIIYACSDGERIKAEMSNMIVAGDPIEPPFGGVPSDWSDVYNYYTILDENADGYTWTYDSESGAIYYPYNYAEAANDWLISPPLQLQKSKEYILSFGCFSSHDEYLESLRVTIGDGKTPAQQDNTLIDLPEVPALDENDALSTYAVRFSVPADGVYYYGFKVYSPKYYEYLFLYNIQLKEAVPEGIGSATHTTANFSATATGHSLRVINPTGATLHVLGTAGQTLAVKADKQFTLTLPAGVYLVTDGKHTQKVMVR